MEQQYTYYAYISYKHGADTKYAKWLRKKLDNYRLPSNVLDAEDVGRKPFFPTFLDDEYLQAGPEEDLFRQHLAASKYLIVICSRNSHEHPFYVNMEIRLFLETGHTVDQIIPLIVEEDTDDPVGECFPSALQEIHARTGIIGNSFKASNAKTKWGRMHDTFLKIVAIMLGVETAKIKRLDRRKKLQNIGVAAVAAIMLCSSAYGYYWQNIKEHYSYYADYVLEYNLPKGILPLSERDISRRAQHYRFTTVDGNVRAVELYNQSGVLLPGESRPFNEGASRIVYAYDERGELQTAEFYNYRNQLIVRLHYYEGGTKVSRSTGSDASLPGYMVATGEEVGEPTAMDRSSVTKYIQTLENGRIIKRQFANGDEYKTMHSGSTTSPSYSSENTIYGYEYEYDTMGRVAKKTYLGTADGKNNGLIDSVNSVYYVYDEATSSLSECLLTDIYDNPIAGPKGWAYYNQQVDEQGRVIRLEYYDEYLEPVLLPEGYFAADFSYTDSGQLCTYSSVDGAPVAVDGYAAVESQFNEFGVVVRERYLGTDGTPVISMSEQCYGWAYDYSIYDPETAIEKCTYKLDAAGNPMKGEPVRVNFSGYGTDDTGKRIFYLEETSTTNGKPSGISHELIYEADTLRVIRLAYYDADGNLTIPDSNDCAATTLTYDDYGQISSITYWGTDNEVIGNVAYSYDYRGVMNGSRNTGIANRNSYEGAEDISFVRNEAGNVVEMQYLDRQGNLMKNNLGYALAKYGYDDYGNIVSVTYLCEHEFPVLVDGFARVTETYDQWGNRLSQSFFGINHYEPIYNEAYGYAMQKMEYDAEGNLLLYAIFDVADGEYVPMTDKTRGYAKMTMSYDSNGKMTGYEVFGVKNGEYVAINDPTTGFAKVDMAYDKNGNLVLYAVYKAEKGEFVPAIDPSTGYSKVELVYDEQGTLTDAKMYTTDGKDFIPV